jgi:hypothetical protein
MLVRHSITSIVGILGIVALIQLPQAVAQDPTGFMPPPPGGSGPYAAPEQYQNPNVMYPPGQTGMQPYPGIDMYRWDTQQQTVENGIWMTRFLNRERQYFGSVEYIIPYFSKPRGAVLGYGGGINNVISQYGFYNTANYGPRAVNSEDDPDIVPTDRLQELGVYATPQDLGKAFSNDTQGLGVRGTLGFENEDGSGMSVNAFWTDDNTRTFFTGVDPSYFPEAAFFNPIESLNMLNPSLSLDLGNGTPTFQFFDEFYRLRMLNQAWGTGISLLQAPIIDRDWCKLRPVIGARYVSLRQRLSFYGGDSGLAYLYRDFEGSIRNADPLGGPSVIIGDGEDEAIAPGHPVDVIDDDDGDYQFNEIIPEYRAEIASSVTNNIAGPEAGFRFDMGGDFLNIWVQTTAGLAVNQDKQKLSGYGIGNHFIDNNNNGITDGTGSDLELMNTRFEDTRSNTLISPMFNLSLNMELNILKHLPVINKMEISENTIFRTGYDYLYISNVARPGENINFYSFPYTPQLNGDRTHYVLQTLSFALESRF